MKKIITLIFPGKKQTLSSINSGVPLRLPLSLLSLCPILEENGYEPRIFDMRLENLTDLDLSGNICVGISSLSGRQIYYGLKAAKYIRTKYPEIKIIWGGIHPSMLSEQTIQNNLVDIIVRGEGELTFLELIRHIEKKQSYQTLKGITFLSGENIIHNEDREFLNMDEIKLPSYHLVNLEKYNGILNSFDYQSSRGCPHRCGFCYNLNFNYSKWRAKSASKVVQELSYLKNTYNVNNFTIIDDNFFVDKKRVTEICTQIIKQELHINWVTTCRMDYFSKYDDSFIDLIKNSGCSRLMFGAESGSPLILDLIEKDVTPSQILTTIEKCKSTDITPVLSFIGGFPTEKEDDLMKSLDMYDKLKSIYPKTEINGLFLYTPYPGTTLLKLTKENGFLPPQSLEEWANWKFSYETNVPWVSKSYKSLLQTASYLVRYNFYWEEFLLRNADHKLRICIFKLLNLPFRIAWKWRWKHRNFKMPFEWKLWAFLMNIYFGYI